MVGDALLWEDVMSKILCFLGLHKWTWSLDGEWDMDGFTKYKVVPDHAWCKRCYVRKEDIIL